jgi:thermosome
MGGQPLFILSEDSERTSGEDAQSANITAGKAVSETVRTTLGPRGMDKMLVSDSGDVVITNDGATILDEMDIEHPAAQMLTEVAQAQEEEVGDGTTTAAVLAGELLGKAEGLLEDDVHPTTIVEGYHEAAALAHEAIDEATLDEELDEERLRQVAESSMTGKGTGDVTAADLAETVVKAVQQVRNGGVNRDNISIQTQAGGSSSATELVEGVIVDQDPAHENMPRRVEDADIAIVTEDFEVRETNIDAEYDVSSVDQLNAAIESETEELQEFAEKVAASGADVVFTEGEIDSRVKTYLAERGILAFNDLDKDEGQAVGSATGASRSGSVDTLEAEDLGHAETVRVEKFGDDEMAFVEGGAATESVTILARGGTEHVVDELERALNDALDVVTAALDAGGVVPGAGSTEIVIADHIREEAASIEGRQQLAVEAFADAVDVLPRTIAENTGLDPIDALVDLRAANESGERAGIIAEGEDGSIEDPVEYGVLDPAAVKHEAIESATEAGTMIVRIDDVISAE